VSPQTDENLNGPGDGCHELLLHLAGQLPDEGVTRARAGLAEGRVEELARDLVSALRDLDIAVPPAGADTLRALGADTGPLRVADQEADLPYVFVARLPNRTPSADDVELDAAAIEAVAQAAEDTGALGLWRAWRLPAEPGAPADQARRVYIVELEGRDPVGNPTAVTTARGTNSQTVGYNYDPADRVTEVCVDARDAPASRPEHLTFMTADGVDPIPDEVLTALARRNVTVGMTFGLAPVPGAEPAPGMSARRPAMVANGRRMLAAGVTMIAGTDAGIAPVKPPDVIRWAIPQFQLLGMTAVQALHACTAGAATALGLGHRKGQLRSGYDADILAVDGDPLSNPAALHAIRARYTSAVPPFRADPRAIDAILLLSCGRLAALPSFVRARCSGSHRPPLGAWVVVLASTGGKGGTFLPASVPSADRPGVRFARPGSRSEMGGCARLSGAVIGGRTGAVVARLLARAVGRVARVFLRLRGRRCRREQRCAEEVHLVLATGGGDEGGECGVLERLAVLVLVADADGVAEADQGG
jgi:YD repeat-containing protein